MSRWPGGAPLPVLLLLCAASLRGQELRPPSGEAREPLERRVARMLLVGTRGAEVRPGGDFQDLVCDLKVGGLILFDNDGDGSGRPRNIRSREQLSTLTADLQDMAERCGDAPLLLAADVEGGTVNRLRPLREFKRLRSHRWLGKRRTRRTFDEALRIGKGMSETGLNWDLAPVVDLDLNRKNPVIGRWGRSFSRDPKRVLKRARAFISGLHESGVLSCLKHFPGHGSSLGDTHEDVADVTGTCDLERELLPYRKLIEEGIVDCVMPAHLLNRKIDPERMMTLSSAAITGLLRGELGFEGVVLSDDLQMGAITRRYRLEEAAVQAVLAGTDMLTLSNNRGDYDSAAARRVHRAIVRAVREGRIPEKRIDRANMRILLLKSGLESLRTP